jgi:hypothetical protein
MTSTDTQTRWLMDGAGSAGGIALVDAPEGGSELELEPWQVGLSPLCDDGKKFTDEDEEEEDLDGDAVGDDADEEDSEFDEDDDLDDEEDEFFDDEGDDDDLADDLDDEEDDDF